MRHWLLVGWVLAGVGCLQAAYEHVIFDAVSLDGAWEMAYRPYEYPRQVRAVPSFAGKTVEAAIPGYWEDMVPQFRAAGIRDEFRVNPLHETQTFPITGRAQDTTLPNIYGCFFYRRTVELDRTGAAVLAFEGVRNQVHVWINGRFAAFREGFSTPFELTLADGLLRKGANEIVLAVSNNPNHGYSDFVSGLTTRSIFGATGGVNGHLELRFPRNDIADVFVTTAKDLKSFTIHVEGRTPYRYEVRDEDRVVASDEGRGDVTLATEGFRFWSPEDPKRYELRLKTPAGDCSQLFGLRRLVADGEQFRLNGKPVYLRGVTEHCYFPLTVHLPRDLGYYRMVTAKRKELGFNFVRFHTFVPPVEYLEATDELGMLVHIESPNFVPEPEFAAIIAFARRHPSVVIYCTGNETRIDRLAETYLEDVAGMVHSMTDSLFSPMSALRGLEYMLSPTCDKVVDRPFRHNAERFGRIALYSDMWTSFQLSATSYDSLNGASEKDLDAWGDVYCGKPRTSHEICIDGSYADLSLAALYPKNSPMLKVGIFSGLKSYMASRGVLDRADLYFRNSCLWMRDIRKYTFEKLRASKRTAGFDFLGDINTHWHTFGYSVGMMDEFYRLKPGETVENVRRYNSAAVLLSDLGGNFNVVTGTEKEIAVSVSNFLGDLTNAVLNVALVGDDGRTSWSSDHAVSSLPNGRISDICRVSVPVPASERIRKYTFRASLTGGEICVSNEWGLYAFPKAADQPAPAGVRVCDDISRDELLTALEHGESVVLLGAGPFKRHPLTYRIGLAGRCAGNYATVVKTDHPLFWNTPNDGWCDWSFRHLFEGGSVVQLEGPAPFDPVIDVASSVKCIIRQSPLFEYAVGKGRLLVCSLNVTADDPAARWLRNRILEYVGTDMFKPRLTVSVSDLKAVIDAPLVRPTVNANVARNLNDFASDVREGPMAQP